MIVIKIPLVQEGMNVASSKRALEMQHVSGPAIYAANPWTPGNPEKGVRHQLLSEKERAQLAKIATIARFKKGESIYERGETADATFNIISGVVAVYRKSNGAEHIVSFLYPGDLFGLSEEGRYACATRATTAVTTYRMPLPAVRRILDNNPDLDVAIIMKLCEELRQAQRHAIILSQKKAATRLAMFLDLQEHLQAARRKSIPEIHLAMDRSSIAAYLGLTAAAISRAFRMLVARKVIASPDLHHVKVLNREALNALADERSDDC